MAQSMRMSYVDPIFEQLGGVSKIARALGYAPSTVRSWSVRGSIPDPQKIELYKLAARIGVHLLPEDFFPDQTLVRPPPPDVSQLECP